MTAHPGRGPVPGGEPSGPTATSSRSCPVAGVDVVAFGVALSRLPINHPVLVAAALAVETAHLRHQQRRDHLDLCRDLGAALNWAVFAAHHVTAVEMRARRATPGYPPDMTPTDTAGGDTDAAGGWGS